MEWYYYLLAVLGGFFAGIINTLAGNGSAITLTILSEFMGLPGNVANGTNRLGILCQGTVSSYIFWKNDRLDLRRSRWMIGWIVLGALLGVYVATQVSNEQFKLVFRWLLVVMFFVIVIRPKRWLRAASDTKYQLPVLLAVPAYLALGFYGGFIQMGMGVIFLAVTVLLARYSLVEANAVKLFTVALYTLPVLVVFWWQGLIDWPVALALTAGQVSGAYLTSTYASQDPRAAVWAHRLLIVAVLLGIGKAFFG